MASSAPKVSDLAAERLHRLDDDIASLRARLAAKERDLAELAARWGEREGYLFRATPEQMRRAVKAGER